MWAFILWLVGKVKGIVVDLSGKLDKQTGTSTYNQAYVKKGDGTQALVNIADIVSANSLAMRISGGRLRVGDAVDDTDASNKQSTEQAINAIFSLVGTELTITLY